MRHTSVFRSFCLFVFVLLSFLLVPKARFCRDLQNKKADLIFLIFCFAGCSDQNCKVCSSSSCSECNSRYYLESGVCEGTCEERSLKAKN